MHHIHPMVVIVNLVHRLEVDSTQEHRHVDALDRPEALVDCSFVLKIGYERPYRAFADVVDSDGGPISAYNRDNE